MVHLYYISEKGNCELTTMAVPILLDYQLAKFSVIICSLFF